MVDTYFSFSLDQNRTVKGQVPDVYDLWFDAGLNLQTVVDAEAVAQRVRQHIELYYGEWFLNRDSGLEWFQRIYKEPFQREVAEALIKQTILNVQGVVAITEFDMTVNLSQRFFRVAKISIQTEFDDEVTI